MPPPPPPPAGGTAEIPAAGFVAEVKHREEGDAELKALVLKLAEELRGLREGSVRDRETASRFASELETLRQSAAAAGKAIAAERVEIQNLMRSVEESGWIGGTAISGLKADLAALWSRVKSLSSYNPGIEKKLEETGKKISEIEKGLVRVETISDRVRGFESEVRAARLPGEKCDYLAGKLEGVEKRLSDISGAQNSEAGRIVDVSNRLGEVQSRMDQLSVLFGYFRNMVDKMRRPRSIDAAVDPSARALPHSPDQEITTLINRL
jgi:chromosome segregation ATPase